MCFAARVLLHFLPLSFALVCWCQSVDIGIWNVTTRIHDHTIMEVLDVFVVRHNGRNKINGSFVYGVPLKNFQVKFELDVQKADNTLVHLINVELDACKFLDQAYGKNTMAKIIMQSLQSSKTFPRRCPLEAHKNYTMEYFDLNIHLLPPYVTDLNFIATTTLLQRRKKIYDFILRGYVKLLRKKS